MAIYPEKYTIFIGIPKTASTSMEQYISRYSDPLKGKYKSVILDTGHASVIEHKSVGLWLPSYFSFAFVRNPWDRLVSSFFFLNSGGCTPQDEELNIKYISRYGGSFERFVQDLISSPNYLKNIIHLKPQFKFITEQLKIKVDFVGRFENLSLDFKKVCEHINIPMGRLPKTMSSHHSIYTDYYNENTKRIVAKIYAKDIEMFGYRFT